MALFWKTETMITEDKKILFSGDMGDQRIGNMLPLEYKLKKKF